MSPTQPGQLTLVPTSPGRPASTCQRRIQATPRKDPIMNPKRTQAARTIPRQQHPPRQNSRPIRIVVAGWCCMLVLAATIMIDAHEVRSTLFFTLIATGMALWVWARASIPALVTSLVLGILQAIEQIAYTISDPTAVLHTPALIVGTLFGIAAGACLVVGSTLAL